MPDASFQRGLDNFPNKNKPFEGILLDWFFLSGNTMNGFNSLTLRAQIAFIKTFCMNELFSRDVESTSSGEQRGAKSLLQREDDGGEGKNQTIRLCLILILLCWPPSNRTQATLNCFTFRLCDLHQSIICKQWWPVCGRLHLLETSGSSLTGSSFSFNLLWKIYKNNTYL